MLNRTQSTDQLDMTHAWDTKEETLDEAGVTVRVPDLF